MSKQVWSLIIVASAVGTHGVGPSPAIAQITPDMTLPQNSIVTPDGNSLRIEGGTRAGGNLFHSFQEFGVPTSGEAFFNNAADVTNILSRVTGGKISHIDGLIRANGGANLFLLNPTGIVFGPNARLNIGGSFVGSTADSIAFPSAIEFSATSPEKPLLTINIPIGLNFRSSPGRIVNQAGAGNDVVTGLQVLPGKTLALVGGPIENAGGRITGPGSRVELGGLRGTGTVELGNDWSLSFPLSVPMADVSFTSRSAINVSGGSIAINAGNVEILEGSQLQTGIAATQVEGSTEVLTTNDVTVNAVGDIIIAGGSAIANEVASSATGNSGNINMRAGGMLEINNALVSANTRGRGNAGNVNINVGTLSVSNGGEVTASTLGSGNGGNVTINATNAASFDGIGGEEASSGSVAVTVALGAVGNGGKLTIYTGRLSLTNGATIVANTFGLGDAGDIEINGSEVVINGVGTNREGTVVGSGIGSQIFGEAVGNGGKINITTGSLLVSEGGILAIAVAGSGNGGELNIRASERIYFDRGDTRSLTGALSLVLSGGSGNGGTIALTAPSVVITNGARVDSSTRGAGRGGNAIVNANSLVQSNNGRIRTTTTGRFPAGDITLNVSEEVLLEGRNSGLFANSTRSTGAGGDISIATNSLRVRDEAEISVSGNTDGNAGEISIAANSLELDRGAIGAESANGRGGNISVERSRSLILRRNSAISATAGTTESGGGDGGNITIESGAIAALEESEIAANAFLGAGGNIRITTEGIFLSPDSEITASSQFGIDGTVEISRPDTDPSEGLIAFEDKVVDAADLIAQDFCRQSRNSSFTMVGRGGLPANPGQYLSGGGIAVGLVDSVPETAGGDRVSSIGDGQWTNNNLPSPIPARGWIMGEDGKVYLVAYPTIASNEEISRQTRPACNRIVENNELKIVN